MARKSGLGRGLEALIPGSNRPTSGGVTAIRVDRIVPNPRQPRTNFDPDELDELAASILEFGIIQPLIVTYDDQADQHILIAGERRWAAARQAGLETVPAILREATEQERLELALIENVQREDLNPLEEAEAYRQLYKDFNLSHEEIAKRVGKSRPDISNTLRLLELPANVKKALVEKRISEGHARALLSLPTPQAQGVALQTILDKGLNVRQTEEYIRRLSGQKASTTHTPAPSPEIIDIEKRLMDRLGTRVNLNRRRKGGTLTIHYYSDEELNALIEQILGESS